jgi:beta-lactamase regulating signal transducer with metallopeptidase domain
MKPVIATSHVSYQEVFASTLLHSLWQGALIVLLMWIIKTALAKRTQLNYIISLFAMIAMALTSVITFIVLWNQNTIGFSPYPLITEFLDKPETLQWFNLIWLIGAGLFLLRFLFSHYYLKKLIYRSAPLSDNQWTEIFHKLKKYYCINKSILLLQSDKVSSAFLTGVIKPVIIIPTSWINQLSYKEAECILAHELSHVFNRDHWVNLFIQFSEIVYYFNPAAHILISHIKLERELKADTSACYYLGEPLLYAKLILKIEESSGFVPALTLPFFQQRKQLKRRIESVLQVKSSKNEFTTGLAIITLVIGVLFFSSVAIKQPVSEHLISELKSIQTPGEILSCTLDKNQKHEKQSICFSVNISPKAINTAKKIKEINISDRRVISTPKRVKITDEEHNDEIVAYEDISDMHEANILSQIERELKSERKHKKTIIYEITKTRRDGSATLNSNGREIPGQVKCYAPVETKTFIIIQSSNQSSYEPEADWHPQGPMLNQSSSRN